MTNRECIYKAIKEYLPTAGEEVLSHLTAQAEKQIEALGKDVIRKLVLQLASGEPVMVVTRIDTKI